MKMNVKNPRARKVVTVQPTPIALTANTPRHGALWSIYRFETKRVYRRKTNTSETFYCTAAKTLSPASML